MINEEGIIGSQNSFIDISSNEYKKMQELLSQEYNKQTKKQILDNNIFSLKMKINHYLNDKNIIKIVFLGEFLKELIDIYDIKHKDFANYVDLTESNLSSILSGKRKISNDLAFKLDSIFKIDANIWINIQNKNELLLIKNKNVNKYKKYTIKDLVKI
ncbi:MAG: hypothetical protein U0457_11885 [Candidatus Sericytochromatia bacterium]